MVTVTSSMRIPDYGKEWLGKFLLFIVWPFGAFLYSLKNIKSNSSYMVFFLYGMLFAWHMNPNNYSHYDDMMGIMETFYSQSWTFNDIVQQFHNIITFSSNTTEKEIYQNFLTWFTKLFADNHHLMFFFASIPYLIFSLKSLKLITDDSKFRVSWECLSIVLLFIISRDILTIQNPRYTTAFWLAIFATMKFFVGSSKNRKWCLFLILLTPLIHSSFWFFIMLFLVAWLLFSHFPKLFFVLFCISIPFALIPTDYVVGFDFSKIDFLPSFLQNWASGYTQEDVYDRLIINEGTGFWWIGIFFAAFIKIAHVIIYLLIWKERNTFRHDKKMWLFFCFAISFSAIINFIQSVPELGNRLFWFSRVFAIYFFFVLLYPKYKLYIWVLLISVSFYIFYRWFYSGAGVLLVQPSVYFLPAPMLIYDYIGAGATTPPFFLFK